ncbi:Tetraspanin family protein [Entamoeba marina]
MLSKSKTKEVTSLIQIVISAVFLLFGFLTTLRYHQHDFLGIRLVSVGLSFFVVGVIGGVSAYLMRATFPRKYAVVFQVFSILFTIILLFTCVRLCHKVGIIHEHSIELGSVEKNFQCCGWKHYYECSPHVKRHRTCYQAVGRGINSVGYIGIIVLLMMLFNESLLISLYWTMKTTKQSTESDPLLPNETDYDHTF